MENIDILTEYPCPICNSKKNTLQYNISDFKIVKCENCSLTFVNPRISNEHLYSIYTNKYFSNEDNGYENYELTSHLRAKTFLRWYNEIEPILKTKKGSALDIGCAAGYFLDVLTEKKWNCEGVELDKEMLKIVQKKGYQVTDKPLEYMDYTKTYELISLFDVLEHLPKLKDDITKLSKLLTKNGSIILVTPNIASFQHKILGKKWFQLKPREHIQYFSLKTLELLLKDSDLKIAYISNCGQYADTKFLYNRLHRYGFSFIAKIFNLALTFFRLKETSWYADTGSFIAVIQKKDN